MLKIEVVDYNIYYAMLKTVSVQFNTTFRMPIYEFNHSKTQLEISKFNYKTDNREFQSRKST